MKNLLLWDKSDCPLEEDYSIEICGSYQDFKDIKDFNEFDNIFVLVDLSWSDIQDFGIELSKKLRKKSYNGQIYLVSSLPESLYFESSEQESINFLYTPGISFVNPSKIKNIVLNPPQEERLSEDLILDINYYALGVKGQVEEIFHNLKNKIHDNSDELYNHILLIEQDLSQLVPNIYKGQISEIVLGLLEDLKLLSEIKDKLSKLEIAKQNVLQLIEFEEKTIENSNKDFKYPWIVLFIDDEKHIRDLVKSKLKAHGVKCMAVKSGEEAFHLLDLDWNGQLTDDEGNNYVANSITCILTDIRLYKDDRRYWQRLQGYDILKKIALEKSNITCSFVLTSKKGAITLSVGKQRTYQVAMFTKDDVLNTETGFNIFKEQIIDKASQTYEAVLSKPSGIGWQKPYKAKYPYPLERYYKEYRSRDSYFEDEIQINRNVAEFMNLAESIKGFRGHYSILDKIPFNTQFKAGLKDPTDDKSLEKFKTKLLGRRIAISLFEKGWKIDDIVSIITYGELGKDIDNYGLLNTHFCLSQKISFDISRHLLVEERNWLEKISPNVNRPTKKMFFSNCFELVEDFKQSITVQENKKLKSELQSFISIQTQEYFSIAVVEDDIKMISEILNVIPSKRKKFIPKFKVIFDNIGFESIMSKLRFDKSTFYDSQ